MSMERVKARFTSCDELNCNPCKDCVAPKRHPGCHDECEEYLKWRKEWDELRGRIKKQRDIDLLSIPTNKKRKR